MATQLTQAVSVLILARVVVPASYGVAALAVTIVGALRATGDLGVVYYLLVQDHVDPDDERADMAVGLLMALFAIALAVPAGFLLMPHPRSVSYSQWLLPVLALTLPLATLRLTATLRFERGLKYGALATTTVVETLLLYVCQVVLLLTGFGVWAIIVAQVVGTLAGTLILTRAGRIIARPGRLLRAPELIKHGVAFATPTILLAVIGASVPVIIATQLSREGLGWWGWSTIIAAPILSVLAALQGVVTPALARLKRVDNARSDEATDLLLRLFVVLAAVGAMACLGIAPDIVLYVFGVRWVGATPAVQISLLSVVPCAYIAVLTSRLQAQGWVARRLRVFLVSGGVTLVSAWPLAHFAGVSGAAVASSLLLAALDALLLARVMHPPLRASLRNFALAGGAMAAVSFAAATLVSGIASLLFVSAVISIVAAGVAYSVDPQVFRTTIRFVQAR